MNQVNIIGRLGADTQIRQTATGSSVATISVATDEGYRDRESGEWVAKTEWHRLVTFSPGLVTLLQKHGQKGRRIAVFNGSLRTRTWNDADGTARSATEIVMNGGTRVEFLEPSRTREPQDASGGASHTPDGDPAAPF